MYADIHTYISTQYPTNIAVLIFAIILLIFGIGSILLNKETDEKDEKPYKSRKQKVREYNKAEKK